VLLLVAFVVVVVLAAAKEAPPCGVDEEAPADAAVAIYVSNTVVVVDIL
jgi:hypothetical protein